jgi:acyl carrier protein
MLVTITWRIRRYIDRNLLDAPAKTDDPLAEGALDSLDVEELVTYIERTFNVRFADEELTFENFASIEVLARLVHDKRKATKGLPGVSPVTDAA